MDEKRVQGAHVDIGVDEVDYVTPTKLSADPEIKKRVSATKTITIVHY